MKALSACPDPDRLRALADDTLPAEDLAALSEHLDGCARCRLALDRLMADHPSWSALSGPAPPGTDVLGPAFLRAVERLQAESVVEGLPERDVEPPALDFLSPADTPGHLGRLGPYPVLSVIGQGGMGVVLKAFDPNLNRLVALKVLAPQLAASPVARKRFAREASAAAAISHEHVVAIHAVEESNGLPYLVCQYVPGLSLQQRLDRAGPLKLPEILCIGVQVARGLAAAHAQGLVHRDVKPANILLSDPSPPPRKNPSPRPPPRSGEGEEATNPSPRPPPRSGEGVEECAAGSPLSVSGRGVGGEGLPDFTAKLTDFGLARAVGDASVTQSGVVVGTPHYMSPEQARGEEVDVRGDLFSLGSVLYAMCTGRPPFEAGSALAVLRRVCDDTPPSIRAVNPEIPEWLVEIIQHLHAKDPAARFQSAEEVADVLARRLSDLEGLPMPLPAPVSPDARPPRAPARKRRGQSVFGTFRRRAWAATVALLLGLLVLLALAGGVLTRLARFYHPLNPPPARVSLWGHQGPVYALDFSPDGQTLATGGDDGTVRLWDLSTRQVRATLKGHKGPVWSVRCARVGELLISGSDDGTVKVWDSSTARQQSSFEHSRPIRCVALAGDGLRAAAAGSDGRVSIWNLSGEQGRLTLLGHSGTVYAAAFSPDSRTLATGGSEGSVRFWDPGTGRQRSSLEAHPLAVRSLWYSPDGATLATGSWDSTVKVWDVPALGERFTLRGHTNQVLAVAFSPDARWLASASDDGTVYLWDTKSGQAWAALKAHAGGVYAVAFSRDGTTLATGSADQSVKLWDLGKQ